MRKQEFLESYRDLESTLQNTATFLWENPELGGHEEKAVAHIKGILEQEGFTISGCDALPTAFVAEYGEGRPVIAILGEYDALPNQSQKVCSEKEAITKGGPGHGCGHNLLGSASLVAALGLKNLLASGEVKGTIRFYGCPEEELLSGKVKMAYYNMFDGCDFAISWHPMHTASAFDDAYLANASVRYRFYGKTAHAAFAPHLGRSALDAVELMSNGINFMREHISEKVRIHYTTDSGGFPPNIVPDDCGNWFYVRAPHMQEVKELLERMNRIAQGAALMTDTQMHETIEYGCWEMKRNASFADLSYKNLQEVPYPTYTEDELTFAQEIQATLDQEAVKVQQNAYGAGDGAMADKVSVRNVAEKMPLNGSSDSGDVSFLMPMCLVTSPCWPIGVNPHTWQATAMTGSSIGHKGAFYIAQVMGGIAYDLLTDKDARTRIQQEFDDNPVPYAPMYEA